MHVFQSDVYLHWPADDQVTFIGSVGQSHAWLWKPPGRINTDVSSLVWSHGVHHIKHHLQDAKKMHTIKNTESRKTTL